MLVGTADRHQSIRSKGDDIVSLFLTLLLSHLVADFPLQWNALVKMKQNGQVGLIVHSLIHVFVAFMLLQNPTQHWPLLLTLGIVHWLIDWTKVSLPHSNSVLGFLVDQAAHVVSIVFIIRLYAYLLGSGAEVLLPLGVLYPAVIYGTVLGTMVFCWVWANTLSEERIQRSATIRWARTQMLQRSQQLGMALVGALVFGLYYYNSVTTGVELQIP